MKTRRTSAEGSITQFERELVRPSPGRTLIVGSRVTDDKEDRRKRYADVVGVDAIDGPGVDVVMNMEAPQEIGMFRHVECTSVLEHCERPWLVAEAIEKMMEPGATLFVSVPFVWRQHGYPKDYWRMTPDAIRLIFPSIRWLHLVYAANEILDDARIDSVLRDGHRYFARTEVAGFGVRA